MGSTVPEDEDECLLLALKMSELVQDVDLGADYFNGTQEKYKESKSCSISKTNNHHDSVPVSLVDPAWEILDPTPNVYSLFADFNKRFFWNKLSSVEVSWSPRMTLCAGLCKYQSRAGYCSIRLSQPLLKLRPRKDLIQTLLHEMIHAYLFVTHDNRDRDDHGPQFHHHMYRINKLGGTNITVYHDFHDEVNSYKTHWWKCNGPCQHWRPFFGFVKRSMNRKPGPSDTWWAQHEATCGGKFVKMKEPEDYAKKKNKTPAAKNKSDKQKTINQYFNDDNNAFNWNATNKRNNDDYLNHYFEDLPMNNNKSDEQRNVSQYFNDDFMMDDLNKLPNGGVTGDGFSKRNDSNPSARNIYNNSSSSSSNNNNNENKVTSITNATFRPFTGVGQVLGGADLSSSSTNTFDSRLLKNSDHDRQLPAKNSAATIPPAEKSAATMPPAKNSAATMSPTVSSFIIGICSICNTGITTDISLHLENCRFIENVTKKGKNRIQNNINANINNDVIAATTDNNNNTAITTTAINNNNNNSDNYRISDQYVSCPSCEKVVLGSEINDHLDLCLSSAFD